MNKENFQLALELFPELDIPENNFNMTVFGRYDNVSIKILVEPEKFKCKTVGCFLGWMPHLPHPNFKITGMHFDKFKQFDYFRYSEDVLGLAVATAIKQWDYLFSYTWANYGPTLKDALDRLKWALENWEWFSSPNFNFNYDEPYKKYQ